jgi:hypothetical protein
MSAGVMEVLILIFVIAEVVNLMATFQRIAMKKKRRREEYEIMEKHEIGTITTAPFCKELSINNLTISEL